MKIKGINYKPRVAKATRVIGFSIPTLGRIAFTRDPGEASVFSQHFLRTRLTLRHLDPKGRLIEAIDAGAGTVTNVGVYALASDFQWAAEAKAKEPFNVFNNLKYHAWSKATVEEKFSVYLTEPQEPTNTEASEVETRLFGVSGTGAPKYITKGRLKAAGSTEIKSWGIFSGPHGSAAKLPLLKTYGHSEEIETVTENSLKIAAENEFEESNTEAHGERGQVAIAKYTEGEETWLYIKTSKKRELFGEQGTVTSKKMWFKSSTGAFKEPATTNKFKVAPVMWDQKKFTTVGVTTGNEIEFIYELEFPSNG